ncbi:hypothetical protein PHBOTO_001214 [Pseudozyma hubeiensis]|nr:hypothetical protein PHBOTO_001214 [Pseudozyma hubeiensis]
MRTNIAAILALSTAALFAASPAQAQIASLDLGNGNSAASSAPSSTPAASTAAAATSSAAPSSAPTSAITAASGSDAPATSTVASSSISSPAYAAGTVTYIPPPLPSSTASIDVTSLPSSVPAINATASSNYTLPNPTATGTFASIPTLQSNPYQIVFANTDGLPTFNFNLALNNTEQVNSALCASQMQFCATAGCNTTDAKLTNFCETKYMGVACSCSKGASRLEQYQWPIMLADCQGRNIACRDACIKPGQSVEAQNTCLGVCTQNYGSSCGKPGQYAANYAVSKEGNKPSYTVVQGGTAQNAAIRAGVGMVGVMAVAAVVSAVIMV